MNLFSYFDIFIGTKVLRYIATYERGFGVSILSIATTKGGAGKTTLARLILARSALAGLKTAAIDADFNHTLTDWVTTATKHPITVRHELDETRIVPTVSDFHDSHDVVVIDTA